MSSDQDAGMDGDKIIRDPRLLGSERAGALLGGNGGGGGDMLETRVAKLESDVEYIKRDVAELRSDTKQLSKDVAEVKGDVKMLVERSKRLATTAGVYGLAFTMLALFAGVIAYAPKLQQWVGTAPAP